MPRIPRMISGANVCFLCIKTNAFVTHLPFPFLLSNIKPADDNISAIPHLSDAPGLFLSSSLIRHL